MRRGRTIRTMISLFTVALVAAACRTTGTPGASGSGTPTSAVPTTAPSIAPTTPPTGPIVPRWGAFPSPARPFKGGTPGGVIWSNRVPTFKTDGPSQVVASPDGRAVFVVEITGDGPWAESTPRHAPLTVMAFRTSDGHLLWQVHLGAPIRPGTGAQSAALAVSPDGTDVFVTGSGAPPGGHSTVPRVFTAALRATDGYRLWTALYGPGGSGATAIAVDPVLARVYVAGSSHPTAPNADFLTVAYRAGDGHRLWAATYAGPAGRDDAARSIAVDPRGTWVAVTGWSEGSQGETQTATVLYAAADGTRRWVTRQAGAAALYGPVTQGSNAAATTGAFVYVLGRDLVALRASDGRPAWTSPAPAVGGLVAVNPNGRQVLVTGYARGSSGGAVVTLGYRASDGHIQWRAQDGDPRSDAQFPSGLTVSPNGRTAFVIAWDFTVLGNPGVARWRVVAYATSNGAVRWMATHRASDELTAFPDSVAANPGGGVLYVVGDAITSPAGSSGAIVEVLAYRA